MREAYRKKGWAFKSGDSIEQCKREGWGEKMKAQKNEGCMVFGFIEVNKVWCCLFDLILYVPSTIFQFNSDWSSWVEPVLS